MKKQAVTGTCGAKHKRLMLCATRTIIFQRENLDYLIVCITQCTLFFQHLFFYCQYVCHVLSVENVLCNKISIKFLLVVKTLYKAKNGR